MDVETIIAKSADSDLVFLPFRIKNSMLTDINGYSLERVLTRLPPVALVMAAKDLDLDAEPEEGRAGLLAQAMDHLNDMERRLEKAQSAYLKLVKKLESLEQQLKSGPDEQMMPTDPEWEKERSLAAHELEKSGRKVAREEAKLKDAVQRVKELSTTGG